MYSKNSTKSKPLCCNRLTSNKFLFIFSLLVLGFSIKSFGQIEIINHDFNSGNEGWTTTDDWFRDNSSFTGSDGNHWHSEYNNYSNNASEYITSGTINLSGYGNLTLSVDIRYNTENNWDGFNIEYSDDGGSTWNVLGESGEGTNWYNDTDVDGIGNNVHGWDNDNGDWQTASIQLPSSLEDNSSVQFQFVFGSDGSQTDDGVAFDNFIISGYNISNVISHDFNSSNNGWTTTGDWVRDDSSFPDNDGIHWHIPYNNYNNNMDATVTSGTIDLSGKTNLILQFDIRYNTEADWDGFNIECYDGSSWSVLGSVGEGSNWYNDADVDGIANNANGWSGDNSGWNTASIELPASLEDNANVQFQFVFGSDGSQTDDGVAFDNFTINEYSTTPPEPGKTWYAYSSTGNWSNPTSWTLDGGANPLYVNGNSDIPGSNDIVVIPSGKKITIQAATTGINVESVEVNGELDLTSSTGQDFNVIKGNGTILMEGNSGSDNFPSGTATLFTDSETGGTLEIYGTGINLDQARTLNNLTINLTSGTAALLADITLNGDLNINSGDFDINDASSSSKLTLTVNGDINVANGTTFGLGNNSIGMTSYDDAHEVYCYGNFSNNGSVEFTNQTQPTYNAYPNHAVNLTMTGNSNNNFICNGTTNLYRLIIDKGDDQTYALTVNSSAEANFRLYGRNNEANGDNNTESKKALWIKNGTLELTGNILIPTLTEGNGDYYIPSTSKLLINGENVTVYSTARSNANTTVGGVTGTGVYTPNDGSQSFSIYGAFQIDNGTLLTESHGFVLWDTYIASVTINGGTIYTPGLRSASTSTGKYSYIQNGGTVYMYGDIDSDGLESNSATFSIKGSDNTFIMTGGTLEIQDANNVSGTNKAIEIESSESNFNVTGGTIRIKNPDNAAGGNDFYIETTAPFYDLEINTTDNEPTNVYLLSNLEISNDFTISDDCLFDVTASNYDINIGADFTIESGGDFDPRANTTTFDGTKRSDLNFTDIAPAFENLTIAKTVDEKNFAIFYSNQDPAITVAGETRIEKGAFDYNSYNVTLNGDLYIADSLGIAGNTGKVLLYNLSSSQSMTSSNGIIQNIEINNTNDIDLSGDLKIIGTLTLTNGVFDINTYKLTLFGSNAGFASTVSIDYNANKMIQTDGNASDGGLEMYLDANETLLFPIGTDANNGGSSSARYTPALATFSTHTDSGYIQMSIADSEIPMTEGNGGDRLSYYWKVRHSEFETLPAVSSYVFTHDASDEDGGNVNNFKVGKVLDESPYTQSTENSNYDRTANTITFNTGFNLELASYSAGNPSKFGGTPDVYYTKTSGNFNSATTWSKNDDAGNGTEEVPVAGSIVIIQNSDRVNVYAAIPDLGNVQFDHDYTTNPTPDSENVPRLQFLYSDTYSLGSVSGTGMVSFDASETIVVNGDFGDFGRNTESYYLYFGGNATLSNIPTPVPNIMFEAATYNINQDLDINGSLIAQLNAIVVPWQNLNIEGDLLLGANNGCTFQLPSQATAIEINIEGNIDFTYDPYSVIGDRNLIVEQANSNNVEHKIILKGDIIHGSENGHDIDLWYSNTRERVILELQGEADNTYSRTSNAEPELYRLILNKGIDQSNSFSFNESFTLRGATNTTSDKALELLNGELVLNDAGIAITLTSGNPFSIPSTTKLKVTAGTVSASGNEGGITLDGCFEIDGGTANLVGNDDEENYIEYGSSGNATLTILSGTLNVGTQIRRLASNNSGVLNYTQTGGDVTIGLNTDNSAYDETRGMLEVVNTNSNFTFTGGTLTIVRQNGANPSIAALYLDPDDHDITGSTIVIGHSDTPTAQNDLGINSNIELNNLTLYSPDVADDPNVLIDTRPLEISGNLLINSNITLDGNGLMLTVEGNFENDGTYSPNNNITKFSSDGAQSISGTATEDFYKFEKYGSGTLTLEKAITVSNTLDIDNGTIHTDTYTLTVKDDVTLDGSITTTSGYGIIFNGDDEQKLKRSSVGQSSIGIMTHNNENGVKIDDNGHSFLITSNLRLQKGVFNIGGSLLELGTSATIDAVEDLGIDNMIQTNSSFQDNGIKKNFTHENITQFVLPVGQEIYSPITIDFTGTGISAVGSTSSSLTVRPANELHPTINDGDEYFTTTGDTNNVLQYYWILRANNVSSLYADISFIYDESDALTNETGYDSTNYIAARILTNNNASELINKFTADDDVLEDEYKVVFEFGGDGDDGITGDYFAGINEAIPSNVATYTTTGTGGDITNTLTYIEDLPTDGVAPKGAVLVVSEDDEIVLNVNSINLYKTVINANATLTIDETKFHRLGTVTGTGNIKIISNSSDISFPAGDYIDFFDCSGGGLEYAGTGDYTVLGGQSSLRNLIISGSGTKEMANNDVEICEDFTLNGPTFDNVSNKNMTINGDMTISAGELKSGSSGVIDVTGDVTISGGTYSGESGGSDSFGSLTINNTGTFNAGSGGSISIQGDISFSGSSFEGGSGADIILNGSSSQTLIGTFTSGNEFYNLQINNSNGAVLAGNITIDNQLTLTNGIITPGSNTLLISDGATISPSEGSASSYISGKLNKVLGSSGDSFVFPIGKSNEYRPTTVSNVSLGGLTWDAEYFKETPTNHASVSNITPADDTYIKSVSDLEYWVISDGDATPGNVTANIGISWGTYSKVSSDAGERTDLEVMTWNSTDSDWDHYGGGSFSTGHTQAQGSFLSTASISFSTNIITLGTSNSNNPLPIELIEFFALAQTNSVKLYWSTATEINNDYFEVERSVDGIEFETIAVVNGAGNSSTRIDYSETDYNPIYGTSYYRIKQTDFDGKFSYSPIVSVLWNNNSGVSEKDLNIYPNPYKEGELILETRNIVHGVSTSIQIFNINGKQIYNANFINPEHQEINLIPMAIDNLPQGMYIISVNAGSNLSRTKLIVE